jgi:hypothetical protein
MQNILQIIIISALKFVKKLKWIIIKISYKNSHRHKLNKIRNILEIVI